MKTSLDLFKLDGRVAIVTGGSKGLGKAMAHALAEAGTDVVVCSRHLGESQAAAEEISKATGRKSLAVETDVSKLKDAEQMVARTLREFGRIDILVNNAGINIRGAIEELQPEQWQQVLDINLTGSWLCARAVVPHMKEHKRGRIINIASTMGAVSIAGRTPYASSKGGVIQMTKTLALELAPFNITCNAICPGPFATEMNVPLLNNPEVNQWIKERVPLGRWAQPDELAGAVIFLASDSSSFVTGTTLFVDGGWTAQ